MSIAPTAQVIIDMAFAIYCLLSYIMQTEFGSHIKLN